MLLGLATSGNLAQASQQRQPPPGFRGASSAAWARPCENPHKSNGRKTGAMKAGLAYEKKVQGLFERKFGSAYTPGQWFCFSEGEGLRVRFCQVDGIVRGPGRATLLIETKINWTPFAWWQLRKLYEPVVRAAFAITDFRHLVVTRNFDPALLPPEPIEFQDHLEQFDLWPARPVHVHLWRK